MPCRPDGPHPNPLPKGEGTYGIIPKGEGTIWQPCPKPRRNSVRSISVDGADHVRLRPVLFVLRSAAHARAGAEPPGRGDRRRGPPAGRGRLSGSDPARPDGQQLQGSQRRTDDRAGRSARNDRRHRRAAADQVRHQPSTALEPGVVGSGPRFAQGVALSARAGAERLRHGVAADEAGLQRRGLSGNARPNPRDDPGARPSRATSSSASAARRRPISSRRPIWSARPASKTASSSSTVRGR